MVTVRVQSGEIRDLAEAVVHALLKQGYVHPTVSDKRLVDRITELLLENLRSEEALEKEAEQFAEKHARQMVGMDRYKVVQGIKARLAKERGFTL